MESPSGSEEPAALKVTGLSALTVPLGSTEIVAVGGLFDPRRSVQPARRGARRTIAINEAVPRALVIGSGKGRVKINSALIGAALL